MSSFLAGAEMMTFLTVPRRWFLACVGVGEASGGFHHHLRAQRLPVQLGRVFFGKDADLAAVDVDGVRRGGDVVLQVAEDGVVFEQMRQRLGSVRSFTATISRSLLPKAARSTLRPMRPKPLMPTLTAMLPPK